MDIDKIKNEIIENVKTFFKAEFDKKEPKDKEVNFELNEQDLETVTEMITSAVTPLAEEISKLMGEAETGEAESEEMKKELEEVNASKQDLEVKLSEVSAATKTIVKPSMAKATVIEMGNAKTAAHRLEVKYANKFIKNQK